MLIKQSSQILALASPVRLAVIDALESGGPVSVSELAKITGVRPDGLYYHLRILEECGLVERKHSPAGSEIVDVAGRPTMLHYDPADKKNREAVTRVVAAMLRAALRRFRVAFQPGRRVKGKRRELWAAQRTASLTTAQLETVNRLLDELVEEFTHASGEAAGQTMYSITFVLSPRDRK